MESYTISCHHGIKKDIISLENVWGRQQNLRFCRKRIRRTVLYLFLWESLKQEEREKGVKYQNQLLSGAYACNEICISCKAKEQGMAWNLNINQRLKTENQIMDVGLYFDHINVCICCLMNISKKTLKNLISQCVLCYNLLILFDPHIVLDEEHEMP